MFSVFSSHSFWTSSSLDVPAGVTQEESHPEFLIHLLSVLKEIYPPRITQRFYDHFGQIWRGGGTQRILRYTDDRDNEMVIFWEFMVLLGYNIWGIVTRML